MALGPEHLLSKTEVTQVDKLEKTIDDRLRTITREELPIRIGIEELPKKIVDELIRRYTLAGWSEVYLDKLNNSSVLGFVE